MAAIMDASKSDDRGILIDYFHVIQCFFVSHNYHQETNAVIVQWEGRTTPRILKEIDLIILIGEM